MKNEITEDVISKFQFEEVENDFLKPEDRTKKYVHKNVILYFEHDTLTQIAVMGDYKGLIEQKLGIGNSMSEFEATFGAAETDEDDNLVFASRPGMCVEPRGAIHAGDWKIEEIYVFDE